MGDTNQLLYIQRHQEEFTGPYLEVGAKDYGSTQDLRRLFSNRDKYIGADMQAGPGVDIVLDFTLNFEEVDATLGGIRFGTIFCLSVLEHCEQPFKMAKNLTDLMMPKGKICLSVPFSWKIHAYPNDYWRFTPQGICKLFSEIRFDMERSRAATSKDNEFMELDDELGKIPFSFTMHKNKGHIARGVSAKILKLLSRVGFLSWLTGYHYVHAPTNILMIGQLKGT